MVICGWQNAYSSSKLGWPSKMMKWGHHHPLAIQVIDASPSGQPSDWHFVLPSIHCVVVFDVSFWHWMASEMLTFRMWDITYHPDGHPFAILGCDEWLSSQTWTWEVTSTSMWKLHVLQHWTLVSQCQSDLKMAWAMLCGRCCCTEHTCRCCIQQTVTGTYFNHNWSSTSNVVAWGYYGFCLLGCADHKVYPFHSVGIMFIITTDMLPSVSCLFTLSSSSTRPPEGMHTIRLGCLFFACVC